MSTVRSVSLDYFLKTLDQTDLENTVELKTLLDISDRFMSERSKSDFQQDLSNATFEQLQKMIHLEDKLEDAVNRKDNWVFNKEENPDSKAYGMNSEAYRIIASKLSDEVQPLYADREKNRRLPIMDPDNFLAIVDNVNLGDSVELEGLLDEAENFMSERTSIEFQDEMSRATLRELEKMLALKDKLKEALGRRDNQPLNDRQTHLESVADKLNRLVQPLHARMKKNCANCSTTLDELNELNNTIEVYKSAVILNNLNATSPLSEQKTLAFKDKMKDMRDKIYSELNRIWNDHDPDKNKFVHALSENAELRKKTLEQYNYVIDHIPTIGSDQNKFKQDPDFKALMLKHLAHDLINHKQSFFQSNRNSQLLSSVKQKLDKAIDVKEINQHLEQIKSQYQPRQGIYAFANFVKALFGQKVGVENTNTHQRIDNIQKKFGLK